MGNSQREHCEDYLVKMNPGVSRDELITEYKKRKFKTVVAVLICSIGLSITLFFLDFNNKKIDEGGNIARTGYNGLNQSIDAVISTEEYEDMELKIEISHRIYSEEEIREGFQAAKAWILESILGDNLSFNQIESDLVFSDFYEPMGIEISYVSGNYRLLDGKGHVYNEDLENPENVDLQIKLSYEQYQDELDCELLICPRVLTYKEAFLKETEKMIEQTNEDSKSDEILHLPDNIDGQKVKITDKRNHRFFVVLILGIISAIFIYYGMDNDVKKQYEKRKDHLLYQYPDFVSKLALLIGAGMSFNGAIRRIYAEMQPCELYKELNIFVHRLDNGILENQAIDEFGRRIGLAQYRKFCSLITMNLSKGSVNLKDTLEKESEIAFENQQSQIRKMGEEAGTKLLIPMVLMLTVVIAMIMIPAFFTYQIS